MDCPGKMEIPGLILHPCKKQVCSCFLQVMHPQSGIFCPAPTDASHPPTPSFLNAPSPVLCEQPKSALDCRTASSLPPLGRNPWSVPSTLRIQVDSSQVCSHQPPQALLPWVLLAILSPGSKSHPPSTSSSTLGPANLRQGFSESARQESPGRFLSCPLIMMFLSDWSTWTCQHQTPPSLSLR